MNAATCHRVPSKVTEKWSNEFYAFVKWKRKYSLAPRHPDGHMAAFLRAKRDKTSVNTVKQTRRILASSLATAWTIAPCSSRPVPSSKASNSTGTQPSTYAGLSRLPTLNDLQEMPG